ncbi:hypothetical protein V6N13_111088 [Hibiscus sabdariffa]
MDASSGNDENGSNGSDASASNGPDSVHFGWNNDMADEESYDAQEDSGESDWLGREHLLSDDDEELNAIGTHFRVVKKKIRNKTVQAADLEPPFILGSVVENEIQDTNEEAGNEANRADENVLNENEAGGIGDNEANGADEREIQGNEASLVGLSTGEETDYLGSSDVGSYETDSDGDFVSRKTTKVFFDSSTSEPRFELGMIFENGNQFKDALYAYAVAHRFDFKFVCNRKEKVRVVCKGKGCPFVVHASWDKSDSCFKVKTLVTDHSCSVTFKNKRANYKFVGKHFISKIRIVPQLRLLDMMRLGREELNVELNKQLCSRAKKWAEEKIKGNISHEFNKLFDYVLALRIADPDGSFDLVVERPTATDIPKFRRFYVCFGALKEGFKRYCRPVIGVDGCFLKGSLKGEILSAAESWAWFLNHLKDDLNLANGDNLTLLSDMQKGLLEEVSMCLPHVEHRYCARHMYANWKKDHKGGDLQLLFWNCCKATTQPLFQKHADKIGKLKPKAYADLMVRDPSHWSKAFFSTRSKCDAIDNNFSEAFNSAIIGARFKSIISMFEDIRHYVMHRLVEHKKKSISWRGEICPRIAKKLEEHKVRSSFCHVTWNGADGYEVMHHEDSFVVDVKGWKCTCRVWDLTGIPCLHAICVILYREESLENYVLHLYKKEVYQELYSCVIPTIPSEKYWKDSGMGPIDPPLKRKLPGRPKHKRRKEEGEVKGKTKLRKLGAKINCRYCGRIGHNIRTCPKKQQAYVHNHADQPPPMPTSTGPSSPSHSIGPSAPQPSNTPSSPPHSNGPAAPPMVFMPTPSVQSSFAFDSPPVQPLVTKKIVFSPKRKVTANRIPMYRKSREHVTPSTTDMSHVSSQPAATVSVPKEAIPSKLTIWKH